MCVKARQLTALRDDRIRVPIFTVHQKGFTVLKRIETWSLKFATDGDLLAMMNLYWKQEARYPVRFSFTLRELLLIKKRMCDCCFPWTQRRLNETLADTYSLACEN